MNIELSQKDIYVIVFMAGMIVGAIIGLIGTFVGIRRNLRENGIIQ